MKRNVMFTGDLTPAERAVMIRFAIEIGTAAECHTNCLLRPFDATLLEAAFREKEAKIEARERAYIESAKTFDPARANDSLRSYLGGDVTNESYAKYVADLIRQEEEVKSQIRRSYHVTVDYAYLTESDEAFHKSLSPRVTFGDGNELYEACAFTLTREIKDALLDSSLGDDPEEGYDYGAFYLGETPLCYEDLEVTEGGEPILSTVSHEGILDLFLCKADFEKFVDFELQRPRNRKIAAKLLG